MKKQLSKRIEKGIRIGILSVAFILAFSISIAGINYIYFRWNCKKLDAVNAVACKYEKKNAILNSFMFLGYFPDPAISQFRERLLACESEQKTLG